MDLKEKIKLKKFIRPLKIIRGRHTELVSVYIPTGYDIIKIIKHLEQEQGTASNIKDAKTRNNVIDSLGKIINQLRLFKKTPPNGLAIFGGNVSDKENKIDIQVYYLEPPVPLNQRIYRCDQTFKTDILEAMMSDRECYGLIAMDRREATIGLLRGTQIQVLHNLTSGVPGKFRAGGQCLAEDSLIMMDNGKIIEIKDAHNPGIVISENFNQEKTESTPIMSKWENKKDMFDITTCYPKINIKASGDHTFFVRTENGIEEKPVYEIIEGDYLIMPEKIKLKLKDQKINFSPRTIRKTKKVNIPNKINPQFARILGYYLGDGNYEIDRINFSEERKEVVNYYSKLISKIFKIKTRVRFREEKNYYELRAHSRILSQLFRYFFNDNKKTFLSNIPEAIMKSSDDSLAGFISGFFDAEGWVKERVAFGIPNKHLARQMQFILLRFGIITSISEYDNKANPYSKNIRYTISIYDTESLKNFYKFIGFCSKDKQKNVKRLIKKRSNRNKVRQLVVNGKDIARILRNSGLTTTEFNSPLFFVNKRQMSKGVFKNKILNKIKDKDLRRRLEMFYNSNLISIKIEKIKNIGLHRSVDIETKNHNFVANGIITHNSSQRFERLIEGMALEFYKRVSAVCNDIFLPMKTDLQGIIVGGPGPTKESFMDQLNTELKRKVKAVLDITYTDESGLHDLVEKAKDILAKEAITAEREIMQKFFTLLAKEPEKTAYGKQQVKDAIEMGAVDTVMLSEALDEFEIEGLADDAEEHGSKVMVISTQTREGQQLRDMGKVAAILRYAIS